MATPETATHLNHIPPSVSQAENAAAKIVRIAVHGENL